jgi:uncharacterized MAPEG superfamily protein
MTTPFYCVLVAWVLIYLPKIGTSIGMARQPGGYDNKHPRAQQAQLSGWPARAHAAHLNSFETFPAFAAAVIVAHLAGADPRRASLLSLTFVITRALYFVAYVANVDKLRSTLWGIGILATFGLFVIGV